MNETEGKWADPIEEIKGEKRKKNHPFPPNNSVECDHLSICRSRLLSESSYTIPLFLHFGM
jgi:hypothetical protein